MLLLHVAKANLGDELNTDLSGFLQTDHLLPTSIPQFWSLPDIYWRIVFEEPSILLQDGTEAPGLAQWVAGIWNSALEICGFRSQYLKQCGNYLEIW